MRKEVWMKTGTTFRSDDEYWAWVERQARIRERLYKAIRNAALMAAFAALLFAILYCFRNAGQRHYDPWQNAIHNVRTESG